MKTKLLLALLACAGLAAALALASPTRAGDGTTTGATTTTTGTGGDHHGKKDDEHGPKNHCQNVSLKGDSASGSVAFTVTRADHKGSALVGKQVTLTLPAGASVNAKACLDASGNLTLRELHVGRAPETSTTTGATTTTS